ncbi:16S rRNA (adenine(1518)-N(6)/adenine(1519)-N(6))-dimethyltransferase RsmA [Lichenicola cladoniae]|uniref:Ribosomal RNA small subunit methyltransferase A n=1 Tax=Lichenicola cladoniae TaxID=1484109 RepID=A0A6M8HMM5_9PROT|nr:16S rRNA (adenine(1518)-N(6)/adenine(1519)-N(6))-dimethyltransferase RsmA [Lichenicola cladoniae]NPD67084.1 16S rRNA (adenine(1518)-N(6)/adenine(1519)-N(6))-dimethyltransferase RsmA [Acetobacteraceae bacterium]QKE89624.1 16S rRNA (adenine(1518)-N(6)/adenine(1519)-N(6))-dimethyltransferase RsmA [Lichenicola cladoniae]
MKGLPAGLPSLREVLSRHGLDARKSLGQHFLLDPVLLGRIVAQAGDLDGRHVVEVGPGPGGLTRALLATSAETVTAIEIDSRAVLAIEELRQAVNGAEGDRLRLIEDDAMRLDLASLVPEPRQIVANLPYNVGTPLLIGWLRQAASWERLTLMFQMEVAERIAAAPGADAYGRLAVLAQWTCRADLLMRIPPGAFLPPPKVFSAVVGLIPHPVQPPPDLFRSMERLTAAAFGQRRKMLRGSLKSVGGEALLDRAGIDPQRRAETLSVEEFDRLAQLL